MHGLCFSIETSAKVTGNFSTSFPSAVTVLRLVLRSLRECKRSFLDFLSSFQVPSFQTLLVSCKCILNFHFDAVLIKFHLHRQLVQSFGFLAFIVVF